MIKSTLVNPDQDIPPKTEEPAPDNPVLLKSNSNGSIFLFTGPTEGVAICPASTDMLEDHCLGEHTDDLLPWDGGNWRRLRADEAVVLQNE